jgi:hypothetical protein
MVVAIPTVAAASLATAGPARAVVCRAPAYVTRTLDGAVPAPLPPPKRLLRFVQLSDVHLYDDDAFPLITGSFLARRRSSRRSGTAAPSGCRTSTPTRS